MLSAQELIDLLGLQPLPREGGYYRETYRSPDRLAVHDAVGKSASTAIYYLLTADTFSALHRLPTDEVYHFYLGDPVHLLQLPPDGPGRLMLLGTDLAAGQQPQLVVRRGVWQGSFVAPGGSYALLGTTMAPGFDPTDYEAADAEVLRAQYPTFADLIRRLTR